jgi:sigma-B regulation protein RsbU (phosphoserine phosphatase)
MDRILVVDDNPSNRKVLVSLLKKDYAVTTAENGLEAVELNRIQPYDIILMDLMMPVMDGITAIENIREAHDKSLLPILVISAVGEKEKWLAAFDVGANDFIQKPFHKNELRARVTVHLQVARLTRELARKNQRLMEEKKLARGVQLGLLPRGLGCEDLEMESFYRPSDQIGGDFFDTCSSTDGVHIVLGDVSGHGTASALIMAAAKSLFRLIGEKLDCPVDIISEANLRLCEMTGQRGMFVTAVCAHYDRSSGELSVVSAGHNPVFILHANGLETVESTGTPLGLFPDSAWQEMRRSLEPNDLFFLYTDGLTEARRDVSDFFGEERLQEILAANRSATPRDIIQGVFRKVEAFCGNGFDDDVTMLAVRRMS